MFEEDNLFCFILAGGEGSRLKNLTKNTCKPMVKICSLYHLIDFSLINCLTSHVLNVAVIVQYESIDLIKYLFESNMNSLMTNFYVLPPETNQTIKMDITYKNTAHSVLVNSSYIGDNIEDILILSADHVYAMDYNKFHDFHRESGNDLTVSVLDVSIEEASRFGVFKLDDDGNILNFEEKPENPESTTVSMGVYIFKKELLLDILWKLYETKGPNIDFGKDVLPYYLEHHKVGTYKFTWYWLDLGTVDAFWKLNMVFLDNPKRINDFFRFDDRYKISTEVSYLYPAVLGVDSNVKSSLVGKNTFIDGEINHSIIGDNCRIENDTKVLNSVVMDGCVIKKGVTIKDAVISKKTVVEEDVISKDEIICK